MLKQQKRIRYTGIPLTLALSAAVLLTACGASRTAETPAPGTGNPSAVAPPAETAAPDAADASAGVDFEDAFSQRDLSGDYDAAEAVEITLNGTGASADSDAVSISGSTVTITAEGTYLLSGTLENGSVIVDAGKDDKVQLVLDGVSISSDSFAAIYVAQADKVFLTLAEGTKNTLMNGGAFTQIDDSGVDAAIFSKDDLTLNGSGALVITSPASHGVVSKDELTITGGDYAITAGKHALAANDSIAVAEGTLTLTAGADGLHAENSDDDTLGNLYLAGGTFTIRAADDGIHGNTLTVIDGGSYDVTAAEGIEGTYVRINDGTIRIEASDDGINAAKKSTAYATPTIEINGGEITIVMGAGDTDGIDANGNIIINGGVIDVTGTSAFDYDGSAQYNGGTLIVNGEQVDEIPAQRMGGGRGGMMGGGMPGGWGVPAGGNGEWGGRGGREQQPDAAGDRL